MDPYGNSTGGGSSLDNGGEINGDLDIAGALEVTNLVVLDTASISTLITEQELEILDPLITCGVGNIADNSNLGLLDEHANSWGGLIRSKENGNYYLLRDKITKPLPSSDITTTNRTELATVHVNQLNAQTVDVDAFLKANSGVIMAQNGDSWLIKPDRGNAGEVLTYNASNEAVWQPGGGGGSQTMQQTYDLGSTIVSTAADPTLVLKQGAGISSEILEIKNTAGNRRAMIGSNGSLELSGSNSHIKLLSSAGAESWTLQNDGGGGVFRLISDGIGDMITCTQGGQVSFNDGFSKYAFPVNRANSSGQVLTSILDGSVLAWNNIPLHSLEDAYTEGNLINIDDPMILKQNVGTPVLSIKDNIDVERIVLHGDGKVVIGDSSNFYSLPTSRGSEFDILRTDDSGGVTWEHSTNPKEGSTGVIFGGTLSINVINDTKFDVSAGEGHVVNPITGTFTHVTWPDFNSIQTTYVGVLTFVSITAAATLTFSSSKPSNADTRTNIFLGALVHVNSVNIDTVNNEQMTLLSSTNQLKDLASAIGFINQSGNACEPSNLLRFKKSAGQLFSFGSNFSIDPRNPHLKNMALWDSNGSDSFQYRFASGLSLPLGQQDIIPNLLDDGTPTGGTIANNRWGIQRIYLFVSNNVKIMPTSEEYKNEDAALAAIDDPNFITEQSILDNGLLIGLILVKGNCFDLDSNRAHFISAGRFGAGSGAGNFSNLQSIFDASLSPQLLTDSVNNTLVIKEGVSALGPILEVHDKLGGLMMSVDDTSLDIGTNILQAGLIEANRAELETLAVKNGIGTDRFELGLNADNLELRNGNGTVLSSTGQSGNHFKYVAGLERFQIDGSGAVIHGGTSTGYTFPLTAGLDTQVLTTSGSSGQLIWAAGGGGGGTSTLAEAYDLSSSPQFLTTISNPKLTVKSHLASGISFEVLDSGNDTILSVDSSSTVIVKRLHTPISILTDVSDVGKWITTAEPTVFSKQLKNENLDIVQDTLQSGEVSFSVDATEVVKIDSTGLTAVGTVFTDEIDLPGVMPSELELETGDFDFSVLDPVYRTEIAPNEVSFLNLASGLNTNRALVSKHYFVPNDIPVGGYFEYNVRTVATNAYYVIGIVFRDATTFFRDGGLFATNNHFIATFDPRTGSSVYNAQYAVNGVFQGDLNPDHKPVNNGIIKTRVSRTSLTQWTVRYGKLGSYTSNGGEFGPEFGNKFCYHTVGTLAPAPNRYSTYRGDGIGNSGWVSSTNNYHLFQNDLNNSLTITDNADVELVKVDPNTFDVFNSLVADGSISGNRALFGYPCFTSNNFYVGLQGVNITGTTPLPMEITDTMYGATYIPKLVPVNIISVKMTGLIKTGINPTNFFVKAYYGPTLLATTANDTLAGGIADTFWELSFELIPETIDYQNSILRVRGFGMSDVAGQKRVSILDVPPYVQTPIGPDNLTFTGNFDVVDAGNVLDILHVEYEYRGFNF